MKHKIFKYFEGKLTLKETEELFHNISHSEDAKREYIEIKNFISLRNAQTQRIDGKKYIAEKTTSAHKIFAVALSAACIVLLYVGTDIFYNGYRENKAIEQIIALEEQRNIRNNKETQAVLELSAGKKIELHENSAEADKLTAVKTIKVSPDHAAPAPVTAAIAEAATEKQLNTIHVTGKKDYQLTLHDGTKVWIRPGSKFSFPDKFENGKRYVELEGEAYFSVAKDSLNPFTIQSSDIAVKVLGTEFNLKSQATQNNELSMVTGVVTLSIPKLNRNIRLRANQQAILDTTGVFSVKRIDGYKYKAWTEGNFLFINQNLQSIVDEISEWYDIDIKILSPEYNTKLFNGKFSTGKGLDQFIRTLKLSYGFNFYMKNNKLYIE